MKVTKKDLAILKRNEEFDKYGKTKAMYEGAIRSAVRKVWMISKGRKDALLRARVKNTEGGRKKFKEKCQICGNTYFIKEREAYIKKDGTKGKTTRPCLVVHHIKPVPSVFNPNFLTYMFGEYKEDPADAYMVLCNKCHTKIHEEKEDG